MSNNMNTPPTIRWQLLSTVSALALLGSACTAQAANEDTDRPLIWIELGGQMENVSGQGEVFVPAFLAANPNSSVLWNGVTPSQAQKPPKFSFGEEGSISFQPESSDWVFSASARIGRSSNVRHVDHQTAESHHLAYKYGVPSGPSTSAANFAETKVRHQENHNVLDFSVGKDVGLGLFGTEGSSVLNLGVRFAQFASKEAFDIRARPDFQLYYRPIPSYHITIVGSHFHNYHATGHASRNFRGIGPSMSWNASAPLVGNSRDGEVTFDWGVDASLLFGRQKARVRHQETAQYRGPLYRVLGNDGYASVYHHTPPSRSNSRSVTVPNVGGFAGVSWRVEDFKLSLGYRTDFFFGAMDTGIDAVKKSNLAFNGPYASISVGLGD